MKEKKKICIWYDVCPIKKYTDLGYLDSKWVEDYCFKANKTCIRYQMESNGQPHSDKLLPNGIIDNSLPF